MIGLATVTLDPESCAQLDAWQRDLNAVPAYPDRVEAGKERFKRYNVKANAAFRYVREALRRMSHGATRCAYCEHSTPDEVEHIWPKDYYPERVFDWHNYLYACGICNGRKLNQWGVRTSPGVHHTLTRSRAERESKVYAPPPAGDALFIDPREEDPLRLLRVDLVDTFEVVPRVGLDAWDNARAAWTITALELNLREDLVAARAGRYLNYLDSLKQHIADREAGAPDDELAPRIAGIRCMDHPMVWREMQRSHKRISALAPLFVAAPEALSW